MHYTHDNINIFIISILTSKLTRVVESRNSDFPVGTWTTPLCGWTTHKVSDGNDGLPGAQPFPVTKMAPIPENLPRSYALGTLGMPG